MKKIELLFSSEQKDSIKSSIQGGIEQIIEHGQFIMGPEVTQICEKLASYAGVKNSIGCANGTDALTVALMAFGVEPRDVVISPAFTYVATAEAIRILGAVPLFVDVDETFNISLESIKSAIAKAKKEGWNLKGIISVDLFGRSADHDSISKLAKESGLFYISDAAQSFGAVYKGQKIGGCADVTTTSFFPTKPLGCYGDGGMLFTNNDQVAHDIRSICFHGKGDDKYYHVRIGMNSRLDSIQAAVLLQKIKIFDDELKKRHETAEFYNNSLREYIKTPSGFDSSHSSWAVYSLLHDKRDAIIAKLKEVNIPSNIYYQTPLHEQPAYKDAYVVDDLTVAENMSKKIFCLPMHAYVDEEQREYIVNNLKKILKGL
jgi:dTDP-4-amino-4,6-dideoxygalactose transaminase